jgi:hypothetical protein
MQRAGQQKHGRDLGAISYHDITLDYEGFNSLQVLLLLLINLMRNRYFLLHYQEACHVKPCFQSFLKRRTAPMTLMPSLMNDRFNGPVAFLDQQ